MLLTSASTTDEGNCFPVMNVLMLLTVNVYFPHLPREKFWVGTVLKGVTANQYFVQSPFHMLLGCCCHALQTDSMSSKLIKNDKGFVINSTFYSVSNLSFYQKQEFHTSISEACSAGIYMYFSVH